MRKWFMLILTISFIECIDAQNRFEIKNGPFVEVNGSAITDAFLGGLNSPQFAEIDLNQDDVKDLLVFDRSDHTVMPFLRVQKNRFVYAPQYLKVLPKAMHFLITADLNSDGFEDIFTSSETGDLIIYRNEYPKNNELEFQSLGEGYYRNQYEEGFPILYNPLSLSNAVTDLPGILDMDGDGDVDIVNYDQFNLTYMMYKDVRAEKKWDADTFEFQNMDYCFGYFWEGFDSEIRLNKCPIDLSFPLKLKPRHVGGASCWFYDEDHDGDMEMYMANLDFKRITRLENAKSDAGHDYDTMVVVDSLFLDGKPFDAFMFPAGYMVDVDKDGIKDMIIAPNLAAEGKESNQVHYYKNHGDSTYADFKLEQTNFIIEKMIDVGGHSAPLLIDLDDDGDLDLLVSNNGDFDVTKGLADRITHFENVGTKENPSFEWRSDDYLDFSKKGLSKLALSKGDVNNDGKIDLLYGTRAGQMYYLPKTSSGWGSEIQLLTDYTKQGGESSWSPAVFDYNEDGINDLLVGFYNGNVALFEGESPNGNSFKHISSTAYGMKSNLWLTNVSEPDFASYGNAKPVVSDIDNDGNLEVVLGGFDGVLRIYHPEGHSVSDSLLAEENGFFRTHEGDTFDYNVGFGVAPTFGDLTGDSIPELIIGGVRGGMQFGMNVSSQDVSIAVNEFDRRPLNVFPNPIVSGKRMFVQSPDYGSMWQVKVFNIHGQLLKTSRLNVNESNAAVETVGLKQGVYQVCLTNDEGVLYSSKVLLTAD